MKKLLPFLASAFSFLLMGSIASAQSIVYNPTAITLTTGVATNITPTITPPGGGYALSSVAIAPALVANGTMAFSTTTGDITGTPATAATIKTYTVTATFKRGGATQTANQTITITIVAPPVFTYASPQTYTVGTAITALSPTGTGTPITGATIAPAATWATTGLTLNANGTISGTPTGAIGATVFTVTAVGSNGGTGTATITITVNLPPPAITYSTPTVPPYTFYQGITITAAQMPTPTNTGGAIPAGGYSISPTLPAGFTFNTSTGVISGTPTATSTGTYTVTATNTGGSSSYGPFTINVVLPAAPNITYSSPAPTYVFIQNTALTVGTDPTPTNTGGPLPSTFAYSFTGTLPAGLAFSTTTGIISGTPTVVNATPASITVTAANAGGTSSATFTITINPKAPVISYPGSPYTFYAGVGGSTAAATNTGGAATFSVDATTPFPAYLSIDPATGIITASAGAVTTAATVYKIDATNVTGTGSANVTITIVGPPAISYAATPYTFVQGTVTTIPIVNGGGAPTGAPLYPITGALPTGITYNTGSGQFSIAATATVGTYTFTVNASNPAGSSAPAAISITINPKLPVISYTPATYTFYNGVGGTTSAITNTGGTATYAVDASTPFPAYLSIDPATGIITASTGAVTTAATVYKIDATNVTGTASTNVTITIAGPPDLSYAATPYTYVQGTVTTIPIVNTGGPVVGAYAETGSALPTGITFNTGTGLFSIAATATVGTYTFSVNASNPAGSSTPSAAAISITINPKLPVISYTPSSYSFSAGVGGTTSAATNTGGTATYSFDASTPPPAYLTIDPTTGIITASSAAITTSATVYKIDATNVTGTGSANVTITILSPPGFTYTAATGYIDGTAMTLSPVNTAGAGAVAAVAYGTGTALTATGLNRPYGMTFDASGNLYVVNYGTGGVTGTVLKYTGGTGTAASFITGLTHPTGVVVDAAGNVYVSTVTGYVYEYTSAGALVGTVITGGGFGNPASAYGLAIDASGNLYIADETNGNIYKYTASTATTAILIANGTGNLQQPVGVTVDASGNIYTLDNGRDRVQKYTSAGGVINNRFLQGLNNPYGLSMDASGNLYVGDSGAGTVTIYNQTTAAVIATLTNTDPRGIATDASGDVFVSNYNGNTVTKYPLVGGYYLNYVSGTTSLPPGLTFNTTTGVISGTPTAVFTGSYTVKAYNSAGSYTCPSFTIVCGVAPVITYTTPNTWSVGTLYTLMPTSTGGTVTTWAITGTLPAGVTFNTSTGVITGTPTAVMALTSYTVTATNTFGTSSPAFTITVNQVSPNITYITPDVYTVGATVNLPVTNPESAVTISYAITAGTLPVGLTLNTTTGLISGTANTVTAATTVTVTASTGTSTGTTTVAITVNPLPPVISYTNPAPYTQGTTIANLTPANSGGAVSTTGTYAPGVVVLKAANGLNNPYGMTADASGNVYVVNYSGNSVTEYSTTGTITTTSISGGGTGPVGLVFDSAGNAYVLYKTSNKVVEYAGGNFAGAGTTIVTGLNAPTGIAIDGSDNLYIANSGANNILEYTSAGVAVQTITPPDNFFGEIANVSAGIAVDAAGNIYVADADLFDLFGGFFGGTTVDVYSPAGAFTTFYEIGTNNSAISIDANGDIYLTDTGAGSVTVSTAAFASTLDTETGYTNPEGTVADGLGDYFVSDYSKNTVTEYSPVKGYYLTGTLPPGLYFNTTTGTVSGRPQTTFGLTTYTVTAYNVSGKSTTTFKISCVANPPVIAYTPPTDVYELNVPIAAPTLAVSGGPLMATGFTFSTTLPGTLSNPWGMTTDASGDIWVANYGNATVVKYSAAGVVLKTYTVQANPTGVVVDAAGNFYVSRSNGDVYKYNAAGTLQSTSTTINNYRVIGNGFAGGTADGIAIDASGNLYVTDNTDGIVWKIPSGSTTATQFIFEPTGGILQPTGIAIDAAGNIFIVDIGAKALIEYSPLGAYEAKILSGLTTPYGIYIDANGDYFVGDSGAGTVKEYNEAGTLVSTIPAPTGNPRGLTVDASGNLYVSDYTAGTVKKYVPYYYSISPGLPAGLAFNTTTGAITGTPTTVFGPTVFTISVKGSDGNASTTVTLQCASPPVFTYTSPQTYIDQTAIPTLSPIITAGGPITSAAVTTNGPLPAGLTLNADGSITGTPTVVTGPIIYTITGTNSFGFTGTATVTITCDPQLPIISYTTPDTYNVGTAITPLTPTNTGGAVASWAISPTLPAGLSFDPTTGIISGNPTTVTAGINYTVTATNITGSATCIVNITITTDAPVITYVTPDTYTVGTLIAPLAPTVTGAGPITYAISPGLPAGLNFDTTTGIITGTPTAVTAAANYVVTATNAGGSGTFTINIACVAAGPVISYTTPDVFPLNIAITPLSPVNTGTPPIPVNGYSISPGLPTGLNFDTTTGIISGTPTGSSSPLTPYTITATDASGNTGTFIVSIACVTGNDWVGTTSNDWNDFHNWSAGTVPASTDVANIGVNVPFTNFPTVLTGETPSVGAVLIGATGGQAGGVAVNTGATLAVGGTITYQSDSNSGLAYTATLSGAGNITTAGINVTANNTLAATYTETMTSSVANLNLSSNITLTSIDNGSGIASNAVFNITGGIVALAGDITTSNTANSTSTLSVAGATLQLSNAAPLSGLSGTGVNVVSFNNPGATIEYSGTGQTYYTDATINGLSTGVTYNSIKFSGSGLKSPNGTNMNNLFVAGDFTNALTTNDAADYIDLSTPTVVFNGATQSILAGNGTGTTFYNTNFTGASAATITSGEAYIAASGTVTMSGTATLAAGGLLTLNSAAAGSATIAAIPATCAINGTVNVQRFITGGALNYRGYRLGSSPVWGNNDGTSNIYSINYLINSIYLKGQAGTAGGWDAAGNPNVYLYRENLAPSNAGFSAGNYRSINTLGFAPNFNYLIDIDGGPYNIPVGAGFLFFFRGDRNAAPLATETTVSYIPTNTILTASGTLNQQQVTAIDWYTPTSPYLGWTNTAGNATIQGYNLVGNPYASSIDWNTSQTGGISTTNLAPYIYTLDPATNNYDTWDASLNAGTGDGNETSIIASGQGFFVVALNNSNPQLIFNESAKTSTQNTGLNLFMSTKRSLAAAQTAPRPHIRLQLTMDPINKEDIYIGFNAQAKTQFVPALDAPYKIGNGNISISSYTSDNVSLAINQMPFPGLQREIVPIGVSATADGTFTLNLTELAAIPALYTIWLKDAYKADSLDIRDNPTYAFDILHSDTNSYGAHRFSLVMGQNPALMVHLLSFGANKINTGDQVVWTTENEQNYTSFTVQRSTDGGKTFIALGGFLSDAQGSYNYLDKAPAMGANGYRLQMTDLNGTITYSNVVTIMYANTGNQIATNGFIIYPNPTVGPVNLTMNQINATPKYTIEIVNNLGAVIRTATSTQPTWQTDVSALMPGTYFVRVTNNTNNTIVGKSAFVKL